MDEKRRETLRANVKANILTTVDAAEEEAKEAWATFRATRDEELARLVKQDECIHGAPEYKDCRDLGEYLWCKLCGNLGEMSHYADPGHQVDLPDHPDDGRGFGYIWVEADWRLLTQQYVAQTLLGRAKASGDKEGIAAVEVVLRKLRERLHG